MHLGAGLASGNQHRPNQALYLNGAIAALLVFTSVVTISSATAISWEPATTTSGVQIKFEKSGGASYKLRGTGFPVDKKYVLMIKWIDGKAGVIPIDNIQSLLDGKFSFSYDNLYRGEPIEYAVISSDETIRAYARLIPYP